MISKRGYNDRNQDNDIDYSAGINKNKNNYRNDGQV